MKKYLRNERGLTLVEMLATLVIFAIIATIAAVAIGNVIQNSKDKAILSENLSIIEGAKIAFMDDGTNKTTLSGEDLKGYVEVKDLKDIKVTKNTEGGNVTYTVQSPSLTNLKGEKYKKDITIYTSYGKSTESILKRNLTGKSK